MTETSQSYCIGCTGYRWHQVLYTAETSWHEDIIEYGRIEGDDVYEMLKCCGCEQISIQHRSKFSEELDPQGEPIVKTHYYPPAIYRQKPKWIGQFEHFWKQS